ncbi:MAG: tetratricopeptide repeat protein [Firmicutes bacterium]|nr:tetratricopeptide repeat protein [Bacillota bacterium]
MPDKDIMEQKYRINRMTETGQLDEALAELDSLLEIEGESAFAYNKLGVIAARRGEMEKARDYFEQALAIDETFAPAHSNLGNIYREMGNLGQAVDCYRRAISCDSEYATAYHNLGVIYKQQGDLHKAVSHLKRAQRLQRVMARRELADISPRRKTQVTWWIVALIAAFLLYYRFRS